MWKTLYKLAKTLFDVPGSKRIAEMVRAKVEKFKQFVPVLQTICNPGIQDRHWQQVQQQIHYLTNYIHSVVQTRYYYCDL